MGPCCCNQGRLQCGAEDAAPVRPLLLLYLYFHERPYRHARQGPGAAAQALKDLTPSWSRRCAVNCTVLCPVQVRCCAVNCTVLCPVQVRRCAVNCTVLCPVQVRCCALNCTVLCPVQVRCCAVNCTV